MDEAEEMGKPIKVTKENLARVGARLYRFLFGNTFDIVVLHSKPGGIDYGPSIFRDRKVAQNRIPAGQAEPRVVETSFSIPLDPKRSVVLDYRDKPVVEFRQEDKTVTIKRCLSKGDVMTMVIFIRK